MWYTVFDRISVLSCIYKCSLSCECYSSMSSDAISLNVLDWIYHVDKKMEAQWLSGRVLDSRQRGRRFEPHRCHCVVVIEQDTFILV